MNTMFDLQQYALQELKDTYTEHEIKVLCSLAFCKLLHCTNIEIHLNKHEFLAKSFIDKFLLVVEELKTDTPIQYILGETEFAGIVDRGIGCAAGCKCFGYWNGEWVYHRVVG